MTHLFILIRLLLILKLLVKKSNTKGVFLTTGLVFKNEYAKFRSENWDSKAERGGLLKVETRDKNQWVGGERVEVQGRFLTARVGLRWIWFSVFEEQEGRKAKEPWTYHFLLSS